MARFIDTQLIQDYAQRLADEADYAALREAEEQRQYERLMHMPYREALEEIDNSIHNDLKERHNG